MRKCGNERFQVHDVLSLDGCEVKVGCMSTIADALTIAIEHHQAGRLQSAELVYRQILQADPNQADAIHLLGVIAHQVGRHEIAIEYISRSLQIDGSSANVHNNLGGVYRALGRLPDATACYERAVELDANYADAHVNLANALSDQTFWEKSILHYRRAIELKPNFAMAHTSLANALQKLGKTEDAIASYHRSLELSPGNVETRVNLGNALKEQGRLNAALDCYRRALNDQPNLLAALINLGVGLLEQGSVEEAISHLRRAIELDPNSAEAWNNLGNALKERADVEGALDCYRRALELRPNYGDAMINLGNAMSDRGQLDEAISYYADALKQTPNSAKAHSNLGVALANQGRLNDAIGHYRAAINLKSDYADAFSNLGAALRSQGHLDEAVRCCQRAIELKPDFAEAYNHLGNALKDEGRLDEAIDCYHQAVERKPDYANAHSNLIYTRIFCPGSNGLTLYEEHRQWYASHAQAWNKFIAPHRNNRSPDRRLRIGYVSPDFRNHVIGRSLVPLFREHDHQRFEVYCYSDVAHQDEMTVHFRNSADAWRNTKGQSDAQLTQQIQEDQIDILVDLTLHLAQNRLLVFARKPAPIQVSFAGYPGTTGLSEMDYRLTDPYLDPPGQNDQHYSEESVRLPDSFWCFDPLDDETVVGSLPALENDVITFGCLNNYCKVNVVALKLWARILKAVDRSRLTIMSGEGRHRESAADVLAGEGVDTSRLTFVPHKSREEYLKNYHQIDIGLDTIPYNGHMTSLDSFWMGVPVVTLVGQTVAGRAGLCQLMNLGLPELIAEDADQYVQIATNLAHNRSQLVELRTTLRERMKSSPLMDQKRFTRGIETAYQEMWKRWCNQQNAGPST